MNESFLLSNQTIIENQLFVTIFSVLLIIVMFIGVMGNLLVIYVVLNYGRLKTVTNTYLLHLALSDLVFLSGIPFFVSSLITQAWIFGSFVCKLFFLTQGVNQYTSIIILALLSFDRYLAVCHSSKSIIWRSRVNPNVLLFLTWILSFILMLPIIIFTTTTSNQLGSTIKVQCTINFPFNDSVVFYRIFLAYTSIITFMIPLSFMIVFYIKIVYRLKYRVSQQHRRSRTSIHTRRKVSVLVLAVIGVHIFCCSPYWAFQLLMTIDFFRQATFILVQISSVTQFLLFVNSSTNPILYAFLSEIFRLSFKRVFYCCLSSTNDNQYLHEKNLAKRNTMLNNNNNNNNNNNIGSSKKIKIQMEVISPDNQTKQSTIDHQRLSITTRPMNTCLPHGQNRHSSLVPTMSMFSSEASCVSDI